MRSVGYEVPVAFRERSPGSVSSVTSGLHLTELPAYRNSFDSNAFQQRCATLLALLANAKRSGSAVVAHAGLVTSGKIAPSCNSENNRRKSKLERALLYTLLVLLDRENTLSYTRLHAHTFAKHTHTRIYMGSESTFVLKSYQTNKTTSQLVWAQRFRSLLGLRGL